MVWLIHKSSGFKSDLPQRSQRTQSIATKIFAVFASSAVMLFRSSKEYKEPQITADKRRFVEGLSAINRFVDVYGKRIYKSRE